MTNMQLYYFYISPLLTKVTNMEINLKQTGIATINKYAGKLTVREPFSGLATTGKILEFD